MKAARLTGVGEVHLVDEPDPTPGPARPWCGVGAVGLCGSDLHWFSQGGIGDALLSRPLVLGHEFGGTLRVAPCDGQRVARRPCASRATSASAAAKATATCALRSVSLGTAPRMVGCREYLVWPTDLLHRVPDTFSDGAVALLEPLGVALHSFDLGHVRYGSAVAVVGCGPIGLMVVQVARSAGAASIVAVEPLAHRRAAAARCGADIVLAPAEAKASGLQVDVSFEVAGADEAIETSMVLVRPGGRIVLAGIPDDDRTSFPAGLSASQRPHHRRGTQDEEMPIRARSASSNEA